MAKARYSMPPKSVSSLQYDSVLTPLVHADTLSATAPPCCYEEIPVGGRLEPAFSVRRVKEKGTGKLSSSEEGGDGLRRRTGGGVEELAAEMEGLAVGEKLKDPLTMFGVLVPQSLRLSQQYFIQGQLLHPRSVVLNGIFRKCVSRGAEWYKFQLRIIIAPSSEQL